MKKILIVGGTGFLGYHVSKALLKKYKIVSLSSSNPKKKRYLKKVNYLKADISKEVSLKKISKHLTNINYVINFGGYVDHQNKKKVYESHYKGLKNLVRFFLKKNIDIFLQIGSSMEYGKKKSPQTETTFSKPLSHYGNAKLNATLYSLKMFKEKKFPVVVLRPYQIYGPNQEDNRLISYVISQSLKDKFFPCSSGKQFRDFLYISDFVDCIKLIIKKNKAVIGEVFNVGFGKPAQVKKTINTINKKIKLGKPMFSKLKMRKEEQIIIYPNIKKITKTLGWKPKINLDIGIKKTIRFYKKHLT